MLAFAFIIIFKFKMINLNLYYFNICKSNFLPLKQKKKVTIDFKINIYLIAK